MEVLNNLGLHGLTLDPFAGTGKVHELIGTYTVGVELEAEWADWNNKTIRGDALRLPFFDNSFDNIVTSPCYGNRMADHHEARDDSKRITYRHKLDRPLSQGSSAIMQWGDVYRDFHILAWEEALRVLKPDGLFVLNIKDHIRSKERQRVSRWHLRILREMGLFIIGVHKIPTSGMGFGSNQFVRVPYEIVAICQRRDARQLSF